MDTFNTNFTAIRIKSAFKRNASEFPFNEKKKLLNHSKYLWQFEIFIEN